MRNIGDSVYVHYEGRTQDGQVFDAHRDGEAIRFRIGIDAVLPGLEEAFETMEVGEERTIEIPAALAFGERDLNALIVYPKKEIPDFDSLVEGSIIEFYGNGKEYLAYPTVFKKEEKQVTLDFNHPMAGKDVVYWLRMEQAD